VPRKASNKKTSKTAKRYTKRISKHYGVWPKSNSWFFEKKAPELPFWLFLVLGAGVLTYLALVTFNKSSSGQIGAVPSLVAPLISQSVPKAPARTLVKTITVDDAADPTLLPYQDRLYLIFRNNLGGYSVAAYDRDLNEISKPKWITNGLDIPNQQIAAPALYNNSNWYLAYLGGDGFTRLAKYDLNFNPQRSITFATPLKFESTPVINLRVNPTEASIKIYDAATRHLFTATPDMGLRRNEDVAAENWPYTPCQQQNVTLGNHSFEVTTGTRALQNGNLTIAAPSPGSVVTIKLYQK